MTNENETLEDTMPAGTDEETPVHSIMVDTPKNNMTIAELLALSKEAEKAALAPIGVALGKFRAAASRALSPAGLVEGTSGYGDLNSIWRNMEGYAQQLVSFLSQYDVPVSSDVGMLPALNMPTPNPQMTIGEINLLITACEKICIQDVYTYWQELKTAVANVMSSLGGNSPSGNAITRWFYDGMNSYNASLINLYSRYSTVVVPQ